VKEWWIYMDYLELLVKILEIVVRMITAIKELIKYIKNQHRL
jgi:hypothetical protein